MKILLTYNFSDDKIEKIEKLGYEVIYRKESSLGLDEEIKDIDILVSMEPFSKINIDDFEELKWIQLITTGVNQVPKEQVLERDITVTNNKLGFNIPIGEWIVMSILQLAKKSRQFFKLQEEKEWKMDRNLSEIYKKNILFLGTGDIAKEASKRLAGFGLNIFGVNSTGKPTDYFEKTYSIDNIDEILGEIDYLVVTLPYTENTHHFVDKDMFEKLKDGVSIVNIARGTIIDEKELIKNLESGKVKAAALDVFETEPLPENNPLWTMDNVIVTPHNSWSSEMHDERRFEIVYENLKRYKNNEELLNLVDLKKGY